MNTGDMEREQAGRGSITRVTESLGLTSFRGAERFDGLNVSER